MNKRELPKKARTPADRKQIAHDLVRLIELGEGERAGLEVRWDANMSYYNGDKPSYSNRFLPGVELKHYPLIKPKARAMASNVIGTIFSQSPTVLAEVQGVESDVTEGLESQIEFFLDIGRLRDTLEALEGISFCTNNAVVRTRFDVTMKGCEPVQVDGVQHQRGDVSYCGPVFDEIDPRDFIAYPKASGSIRKAQICGHRFWRQEWEIDEMQGAGLYLETEELVTSSPKQESTQVRSRDSESDRVDERLVECWEVIFKDDLDGLGYKTRYIATVARESKELLKISRYELSQPWYTFVRYTHPEPGSVWSDYSLAQDLQGLQWEKVNIRNLMVYGSYMAAFPPIAGTRATGQTNKVQRYGPGQYIHDPDARPIGISFNPGQLENELERIERDADSVIGISQAGTGAQLKSNTTATEAAYLQSAQQTGLKAFVSTFGRCVVEIVEILTELLTLEYPIWADVYADQTYAKPEHLELPIRWQLHGSSPDMLPEVLIEKYKFLLQMAQMDAQTAPVPGMPPPQPRFDMDELYRSILNQMQIPNADKIMPEQGGDVPDEAQGMGMDGETGGMNGLEQLLPQPGVAAGETQDFGAQGGMQGLPDVSGPGY